MNKESNGYTLIYAGGMVILVALVLALAAQILGPTQKKNEDVDKMRQVLTSLNIISTNADAASLYEKTITDSFLINEQGERVDGDAFATELTDELRKPEKDRTYPVFEATIDGNKKYVLSLRGAGLWGPVWGFITMDSDKKTVYGASFGHAGETPGLGAEIDQPVFSNQFIGKKVFGASGEYTSIAIVKPGQVAQGKDYVDGISGGTITSQGVDAMLFNSIKPYVEFLKQAGQTE